MIQTKFPVVFTLSRETLPSVSSTAVDVLSATMVCGWVAQSGLKWSLYPNTFWFCLPAMVAASGSTSV